MAARSRIRQGLAVAALLLGSVLLSAAPHAAQDQILLPPLQDLGKNVAVAADAGWTDTGIDVAAGDTIVFAASGEINLQKGNPEAVCGPAGVDLITVDQPVPNANLGALIGKLAQTVARRVDEDSGVETVDEIFVLFVVGTEGTFTAPFKGRIYLGVNENVLKDNAGAFSVVITRRPA
jgi:hypothetical protein